MLESRALANLDAIVKQLEADQELLGGIAPMKKEKKVLCAGPFAPVPTDEEGRRSSRRFKPTPYKGPLSAEDADYGVDCSVLAADNLYEAANLLFDNKFFAQSIALSILAVEEAKKFNTLREICVATSSEEIEAGWRKYRNHSCKQSSFLFDRGAHEFHGKEVSDEEIAELATYAEKTARVLEVWKQACLYSDCLEWIDSDGPKRPVWSLPSKRATEDVAREMLENASRAIGLAVHDVMSVEELGILKRYQPRLNMTDPKLLCNVVTQIETELRQQGIEPSVHVMVLRHFANRAMAAEAAGESDE